MMHITSGAITVSGGDGADAYHGGGGGSGGAIDIHAGGSVTVWGNITANGGKGGHGTCTVPNGDGTCQGGTEGEIGWRL
jgi:hypothetical protein